MGKLSFRLSIEEVGPSQVDTVIDAIDAQIAQWRIDYPALTFERNSINWAE